MHRTHRATRPSTLSLKARGHLCVAVLCLRGRNITWAPPYSCTGKGQLSPHQTPELSTSAFLTPVKSPQGRASDLALWSPKGLFHLRSASRATCPPTGSQKTRQGTNDTEMPVPSSNNNVGSLVPSGNNTGAHTDRPHVPVMLS